MTASQAQREFTVVGDSTTVSKIFVLYSCTQTLRFCTVIVSAQ